MQFLSDFYMGILSNRYFVIIFSLLFVKILFGKPDDVLNNSNKIENNASYFDYLNDVKMINSNTGYAVGWAGTIVRTTDGGLNWIRLSSPMNGLELGGVFFTSENTGMAVNGHVIRTTDSGENWNVIYSGDPIYLAGISFADLNNGFAVGADGKITHSSDGGNTWTIQQSGITTFLWNVMAVNANNAFIVGGDYYGANGVILKTTDGGNHWLSLSIPSTTGLKGVCFSNLNIGVAVGNNGTILRTTDGGNTWIQQNSSTTAMLKSVSFLNSENGIVVGQNGVILSTTNGGNNWVSQTSNTTLPLSGVSFMDKVVVAAGGSISNPIIITSSDAGLTWVDRTNTTFINNDRLVTPSFALKQNYPNPFNPSTVIEFTIPGKHFILLKIYNSIGIEIETLINQELEAGTHSVEWKPSNLPSGVYYYSLKVGNSIQTKKLIFLK